MNWELCRLIFRFRENVIALEDNFPLCSYRFIRCLVKSCTYVSRRIRRRLFRLVSVLVILTLFKPRSCSLFSKIFERFYLDILWHSAFLNCFLRLSLSSFIPICLRLSFIRSKPDQGFRLLFTSKILKNQISGDQTTKLSDTIKIGFFQRSMSGNRLIMWFSWFL